MAWLGMACHFFINFLLVLFFYRLSFSKQASNDLLLNRKGTIISPYAFISFLSPFLSPFLFPFLFAAAKLLLFSERIVLNLSTFVLRPNNSLFVSSTIINNFIAMRSGNIW